MSSQQLPVSGPFAAFARLIVRAPWLVISTILVVTLGLGVAAAKIRVNNSDEIFFVQDDPLLVTHKRFEQRFGSDEFVLVFLEGDVFTRPVHRAVDDLVTAMQNLRFDGEPVFTVVLSPFHAPTVKDAAGSIEIAPLLASNGPPSDEDLANAKRIATSHPVYRDLLVNRDGTAAAIVATLRALDNDNTYQMFIAQEVEQIVNNFAPKELRPLIVGGPMFKRQMDRVTVAESSTFGSAAILVSVLALFLLFRRKRQVTAAIGVVVIAVIWTVGAMSLLGYEMSLVSIILPLAVVIMGLGAGVHLINEFRELRFRGQRRREAVVHALGLMGVPALMTAITTAIGFLAMLTAPVLPMRELGLFAAVGVMCAYVLAVTLVPAVLAVGDDDTEQPEEVARYAREHRIEARMTRVFGLIGDLVVGHAREVTIAFLLLSLVCGYGLVHTVVESHILQAFRRDQPFRQAVEHVDEKLGGTTSIELVIDSGTSGGVYDAEFLRRVAALQDWIVDTQSDIVGSTLSVADLMREVSLAFTGQRNLPDSRERAAQLMLLYESSGGDLRLVVDHAARRARINIRTRQRSTTRSLALEAALREKATALFEDWQPSAPSAPAGTQRASENDGHDPGAGSDDELVIVDDSSPPKAETASDDTEIVLVTDDAPAANAGDTTPTTTARPDEDEPPLAAGASRIEFAGTGQLYIHLAEYVIDSQLQSFTLATIIISLLMMMMLRSLKLGLAVMVPNILPIVGTYGLMGWMGISVDWLTALIGVSALGVAVDGTIHIGTRYRLSRVAGMNAKEAAHAVLTSTGRAIVVTSGVLVAGFLVLTPSVLASLARFGALMAVCLLLALLFDLLMTPAVLAWLSPAVPTKKSTERA
ncbi:MAG: efflux RND transporter permease subunit [Myxococcota bacterium]